MAMASRTAAIVGAYLIACLVGGVTIVVIETVARHGVDMTANPVALQIALSSIIYGIVLAGAFALPACFMISYAEGENVRSPTYYIVRGSIGGALLALIMTIGILTHGLYVAAATVTQAVWSD